MSRKAVNQRATHSTKRRMKILHSICSLITNSGVTTFVTEIASAQASAGHDVTVWCWGKPETPIPGAKIIVIRELPVYCEFDVVHIHAFWALYQLRIIRWCYKHKVPYFFSPHGGLMHVCSQKEE